MGKGTYLGGSTIVYPGSNWFSGRGKHRRTRNNATQWQLTWEAQRRLKEAPIAGTVRPTRYSGPRLRKKPR